MSTRVKERVRLDSPYGGLRMQANGGTSTVFLENDLEGTVVGHWHDRPQSGKEIVEFDELPELQVAVPVHWLTYLP